MSPAKRQAISALALFAGFLGASGAQAQNKSAADEVEEIVVTAQKRAENLQKVPISIGVLGGANLEKSGARGIADQLNQVGGVSVVQNQPGQDQITIRGTSAGGPFDTGGPPVGYYLDDVPFSFITSAILPDANAFDLERVEVLRGPQGTLYGASSLNGVVRILTKDAGLNNFEVKGRARYGWTENSEDSYSGDVAVNVPVVPGKLALRVVGSYADYGGYVSTPTVKDLNDGTVQNYRVKLNAAPTDRLDIKFAAWISRIDNNGPSEAKSDYVTPFSADQPARHSYEAYNLVLNYDFGPFSLFSSSGYIDLSSRGAQDFLQFSTLGTFQSRLLYDRDSQSFSQEVRATSQFEGPWQATGGVIYRKIDERIAREVVGLLPFPFVNGNKSQSYAAFGEVSRSFWDDKVKLTGGIRFFNDTETTDELSNAFTGTGGPLQKVESDFESVTWRTVLSYYPSKALTLYASAGTGFRTGINQDFSAAAFGFPSDVKPDELLTYEIGAKGSLGGRVSYEIAGYYEKWEDPQQLAFTPILTTAVVNARSASGFGVNANVSARITRNLSFNASGDWNSLEFDEDHYTQGVNLLPKGSRMNTSPELTWSIGGEYRQPVGTGDLEMFISANARYNSKMINHYLISQGGLSPYVIVTRSDNILYGALQAGVETDRWTAALFVENVTNETGAVSAYPPLFPTQPRLRPRTIGVQASFKY